MDRAEFLFDERPLHQRMMPRVGLPAVASFLRPHLTPMQPKESRLATESRSLTLQKLAISNAAAVRVIDSYSRTAERFRGRSPRSLGGVLDDLIRRGVRLTEFSAAKRPLISPIRPCRLNLQPALGVERLPQLISANGVLSRVLKNVPVGIVNVFLRMRSVVLLELGARASLP
jgi:hypothetical protein